MAAEAVVGVVLATVAADFALSLAAEWLNYRALGQPLPREFEDTFDADKYRKSQEYAAARALFSIAHAAADLAILLLAWFGLRIFEALDVFVRNAYPGDDPWLVVPRGLTYWLLLVALSSLLELPWSIYSTFVIEERFGFNNTTIKTFVMDRLKGIMLGLVLGPPVRQPLVVISSCAVLDRLRRPFLLVHR